MDMIETKALEFAYPAEEGEKPVLALRGVDTAIEKGSFVVVLGHNGSGKSTFAKSLNAILLPCGGKVYVEGMDTQDEACLLEIRRRVGMVFQNPDNQIAVSYTHLETTVHSWQSRRCGRSIGKQRAAAAASAETIASLPSIPSPMADGSSAATAASGPSPAKRTTAAGTSMNTSGS